MDNSLFTTAFLKDILILAVPALICITIHELSHGFAAYKLGDNTAKYAGRLTLNPVKHIDIFGLLMIAVAGFGWAKPVPVNMYNFKNPKWGMALTAIAGPLSNLILAFIAVFIYLLLPEPYGGFTAFQILLEYAVNIPAIYLIVHRLALLNVCLALFNLLPIPPLDGSKVLFAFLPQKIYNKLMKYERYGMFLLFGIMILGRFSGRFDLFGTIIWQPAVKLLGAMANTIAGIIN